MSAHKVASWNGGYVLPNSNSNLVLSEGIYSLSSRSNIPYVEILGANGFQKTVSWGEWFEVDCGQLATVKNVSYHPGYLIINSGIDPFPVPARITVPIRIDSTGSEFGSAATRYQFDVRRAKRAYLYMSGVGPLVATVVGRTHTAFDTVNQVTTPNVGSGYQQNHNVPAASQIVLPLGFLAPMGDDSRPMALLDSVLVTFDTAFADPGPTAMFVAEYL